VFQPRSDTDNLTVLVGLFEVKGDKNTLLAWTVTNPVSLAPLPGRAAFAEAMAARLAGDHAKAVSSFTKAIQITPGSPAYHHWRADSLLRLGNFDQAVADYSRALELAPNDRASRIGRGIALLWKEAWQPAIADLSQAIDASAGAPDNGTAWALRARGVARAALGQGSQAIADYRAYLALAPEASDRAQVETWIEELTAGATA
jgi:tetratricopeptide (TPR) repeat protein